MAPRKQSVGKEIIARLGSKNKPVYPMLLLEAAKLETAFDDLYEMASDEEEGGIDG